MDGDAEWACRSLVSVFATVSIDDSPADGAADADADAGADDIAGVTLVRALSAPAI